jgi:hypothetical protein
MNPEMVTRPGINRFLGDTSGLFTCIQEVKLDWQSSFIEACVDWTVRAVEFFMVIERPVEVYFGRLERLTHMLACQLTSSG